MEKNYQPKDTSLNDEIDLIAIITTLWKKKLFIISFTLVLTILTGVVLYLLTTRSYQITTSYNNISLPVGNYIAIKNLNNPTDK